MRPGRPSIEGTEGPIGAYCPSPEHAVDAINCACLADKSSTVVTAQQSLETQDFKGFRESDEAVSEGSLRAAVVGPLEHLLDAAGEGVPLVLQAVELALALLG